MRPRLDVVLPVLDEAATLRASVTALHRALEGMPELAPWRITVADNGSTDGTEELALALADEMPAVRVLRLGERGRGRALRTAWLASDAEVVAYMDIDLSTDLRALPPLIAPLLSGHSDVAIGSRLAHGARVVRGTRREILSRGYNLLLHAGLGASFSDAQCGFKAMTSRAAQLLLPLVEDDAWFFDTEMLVLAERCGLRIAEVPVDWFEDPRSAGGAGGAVRDDLRGMARVGWGLARGRIDVGSVAAAIGRRPLALSRPLGAQLASFAVVGIASTIAYTLLFLLLQAALPHQTANFLARAISAVLNTMVNRRVTFGVTDRSTAGLHLVQGVLVFGATWAITAGALALLVDPAHASSVESLVVLTAANALATVLRFLVFRVIFRPTAPEAQGVETAITRRELIDA